MKWTFPGRIGSWTGVILAHLLLPAVALGQGAQIAVAPAGPGGQRVFVCGHSFQAYMGGTLEAIARAADITDHRAVGAQTLGGSEISQHWDLPDAENKVKPAIESGVVDVLLLSSCWKGPDPAIESFTRLLLAHNAGGRVLVMASWPGYDLPSPNRITDNAQRDGIHIADLRAGYAPYYQSLQAHLAKLQAALTADQAVGGAPQQAIFLVPIGPAVISLRERIIQGKVPGITRQSDLFTDALGHARWPVKLLAGYCEFAVIYRRSPVGLSMPELPSYFVKTKDTVPAWSAALNRVLQEVAWEAVQQEPLCGLAPARLP